jgi:tetratricopeptide (TPR) repeat protein
MRATRSRRSGSGCHVRSYLSVASVALLMLPGISCSRRPRDPVAVAQMYWQVGQSMSQAGLKKCYSLLSVDSRKVTSLDEYSQHYGATAKSRAVQWALDSISLMPEDKTLPTYRRVRGVAHSGTDTLSALDVFYYTLVNENGVWSVVWEMALIDQAKDLYRKGMLDEALAMCDRALALNPYSAAAYNRKAWCYDRQTPSTDVARQARNAAIEVSAKKAIALEPEVSAYYNTLALAYVAQDLPELEIECYKKAIRLPTCPPRAKVPYYANISGAYGGMSKWNEAITFADSALAIDSVDAFAWMKRAMAEYNLERTDSAKASIDRALAVDWASQLDRGLQFSLQISAALIDERVSDNQGALEHVLKALEMDPGNEGAQTIYSRVKRKTK